MKQSKCLITFLFGLPIMLLIFAAPAFSAWTPPKVYSLSATKENCEALKSWVEGLTDATFNKSVTNVTATWIDKDKDGNPIPSYCQVKGWIWPETNFQVTMPTLWNERYQMNGGGGWDGTLRFTNSPSAGGYATSGANGGYMASNWPGLCASFGLKEPYFSQYYDETLYPTGVVKNSSGTIIETNVYYGSVDPKGSGNPYACQKVVDFGIRHLYETPVIAKKIIKLYYGIDPKKSYYSGGSCGGKEGQISAQKFPELYDGFWIGYPLGGHVAVTFRGMWDTFWGADLAKQTDPACVPKPPSVTCPSVYSKYKAALHYKTVYDKCDPVDGLVDGMIDDPLKCKFDAMTDLPACSPAEEAAEGVGNIYSSLCFTLAQRQALKEIYAGPHKSHGKSWYPGQPLSAEYMANNPNSQTQPSLSSGFGAAINDDRAACMFANIALDPPDGPNFDITTFDWDKDPKAMERTTCEQCYEDGSCENFNIQDTLDGITISPRPAFNMGGLEPVYAKGAKIVQTHGWSDALVTPLAASRELYETTLQKMGIEKTKSFWKLYLVPGAGHAGGGLSTWPTNTDAFNAMVDWVENGNEPRALIGSRSVNVDLNYPAARTRPSCPYPEVARYTGPVDASGNPTGNINIAASFMCVPPIEVRIEPKTLNLKSKGVFTAVISVPEGYKLMDWNIGNLSCEGAPMVNGALSGNTYTAKFNKQDLIGVVAGDAVTLAVKGTFTPDGKVAQIQASDTVKVIK